MASLEEIKDLIHKEIAPFNAKIAHFQTTLNELDNSVKGQMQRNLDNFSFVEKSL